MSEIGPTLRQARMREGWDITEVEERTKIRAKYLRALENEEWSLLPGPTFTKGFLRTYAEALGLDWRLLIDEYKREWEAPHELEHVPVRPSMALDPRERARRRPWRWIGALALIVALAVVFVLIGHLGGPSKTGTPPPTHASSSGLSGATATTGHTAPSVPVSCVPGSATYVPVDCVSLRLKASAAGVWACVVGDRHMRIDGARLASGVSTPTFHARRFVVTLASAAVALVIDGRRFTPHGATGPVRYVLTPGARKRVAAPTTLVCRP
jgi:transcriptional regulator with XRE-family HTH domain